MAARGTPWAALTAVNAAAVIFGTTGLFAKLDISPAWLVAGRGAFAAAALLAIGLLRGVSFRLDAVSAPRIAGTGILLALHWLTFFASVQEAGVAVATLTFATFPLFIVLLAAATRRRWPAVIEICAGLAIVGAVLLLVRNGLPATGMAEQGAAIGLLSAVCFAGFSVASQALGKTRNAVALSFHQNIAVTLYMLVFLPFAPRMPHGADWAILMALGVVATALVHQLYFFALKHMPAAACGGFVALEPVYAIAFAAILFSEPFGPTVVISGVLIVGASLLLLSRRQAPSLAIQ